VIWASSLIHRAAASFDEGTSARFATRPNSTRSAASSSRRPFSSRFIAAPIPSLAHSTSSTQVPPSGLDSVNSRSSPAAAASASSGSRNLQTEATSRRKASRFASSSRPKLQTTWTLDRFAAG
jgi:hypothetical protein